MKLSSKKRKTAAAVCAFLNIFGCAAAANVYLPAHVEAAGYTVQEKNPVSVMPINQAKFLKGQRFDLQVEVKGLADDFKVTVEDSVNLEHTYLCHLVKDNLKWLLGIEINEFMECEGESYFVNSLQVELDNLHETQKNSQKIYKKLPCEKSACSISYALKYLY